jgi:hypothetical protein
MKETDVLAVVAVTTYGRYSSLSQKPEASGCVLLRVTAFNNKHSQAIAS